MYKIILPYDIVSSFVKHHIFKLKIFNSYEESTANNANQVFCDGTHRYGVPAPFFKGRNIFLNVCI